jgi:hypothetical protein
MKHIAILFLSWVCVQEDLPKWVDQLGAEDAAKREAAERLLRRQIGSPKVREELEKVEKGGDPERAARAREILGWVRSAASPAGIHLRAQVSVNESGVVTVKLDLTNTGAQDCQVADPEYWDCWRYFTLEILQDDGSVAKGKLKTTRGEGNFRGMAPAAVPLGKGVTRSYSDAVAEGLAPGIHHLRITAGSMEGAKGYEGRAPRELPAPKDAVAVVTVNVPERTK